MFPKNLVKYNFAKATREEWLALRNKVGGRSVNDDYVRFGGSDIGIIMGLSDWTSQGAFFYELMGIKTKENSINPHAYRGIQTEKLIVDGWWRYFDPEHPDINTLINNWQKGNVVRKAQQAHVMLVNPKYPFLLANVDFVIPRQLGYPKKILEIKNMMWSALEKWENDLPPYYVTQPQTYMLVTGFEMAEVFVLKDTTYPLCFPMNEEKELQESILDHANEFANRVLECRAKVRNVTDSDEYWDIIHEYEPSPDGGEKYIQFMKDIHRPENMKAELDMPIELVDLTRRYSELKEYIGHNQDELNDIEGLIRNYFNKFNAQKFTYKGVSISWKSRFSIPKNFHKKIEDE
jgi:predicted phage-related endonuclease